MKINDLATILFEKLDKVDTKMDTMNDTLIRQEGTLAEHIRRTELLEKQVSPLVKDVNNIKFLATFIGVFGSIIFGSIMLLSNLEKAIQCIKHILGF